MFNSLLHLYTVVFVKKKNWSITDDDKLLCILFTRAPPLENILLGGTDVQGIAKYFHAKIESS